MFDAQMIAANELGTLRGGDLSRMVDDIRAATQALFNDSEFEEAVRQGTNTPSRLRLRTQRVLEMLSDFAGKDFH